MGNVTSATPLNDFEPEQATGSFSVLADAVGRFIEEWDQGGPPGIAEFLPSGGGMRRLLLIELIKVDLEYRWGQGLAKRVQEYVADFPELADGKVPVELLYEEFHARQQAGLAVDPQEYAEEYPEHADTLRQWIGAGDYQSTIITKPGQQSALKSVQAGDTVDDFDLIIGLGQGAFAHVYLARQRSMQRLVALKVSADSGSEPQTLAQLDHEAIVRVFDQHVLEDRKLRLLYMQYLPGGTLQTVVRKVQQSPEGQRTGKLLLDVVDETIEAKGEVKPAESDQRKMLARLAWPETVAWIGARLAEGLDYAHGRNVLHRDIKPANVLLSGEGAPKLADFNISFAGGVSGQTPAAYFGGSLAYMSTEQLEACHHGMPRQADDLDGRSDIYSLGVMLWELLTGQKPFHDGPLDGGWNEVVERMLQRRTRGIDASAEGIPASLLRVLRKCLTPHRADRWQSGQQLALQFELCLDERARELRDPPPNGWQVRTRPWGAPIILLANLIPNALAGWFNIAYNFEQHIKDEPEQVQATFERMVLIVNGLAYPLGSALILWLAWRVVRVMRRIQAGLLAPSDEEALSSRRECLRLGERCAVVCLALWTIAGIAHPLAIGAAGGEMTTGEAIHFFGSLVICGLIAVAYPFFGGTYFAVRSLYPAMLHDEAPSARDEREQTRLYRRLGPYLVIAGSIPLLSIGGATMAATANTNMTASIIGWLSLGGVIGLGVVYSYYRSLQADLEALHRMVRR